MSALIDSFELEAMENYLFEKNGLIRCLELDERIDTILCVHYVQSYNGAISCGRRGGLFDYAVICKEDLHFAEEISFVLGLTSVSQRAETLFKVVVGKCRHFVLIFFQQPCIYIYIKQLF